MRRGGPDLAGEPVGFPNAFLGLICRPVVITIAVAALGGVRFPRWFMISAQVVTPSASSSLTGSSTRRTSTSTHCAPWCLLITVTTTLVFTSMTQVNILDGNLGEGVKRRLEPALRYNADTFGAVLVLAILAAMVVYTYL